MPWSDQQLPPLNDDWHQLLRAEFDKPYFLEILSFLSAQEQQGKVIYPQFDHVFNALNLCSFANTRVIILGQDPYHGQGQAHGLSFSVPNGVPVPPSLQNIFSEIRRDLGRPIPASGNLEAWASKGILLLNTALTVEAHQANSHAQIGWHQFTDQIISQISNNKSHCVFMLWGRNARDKNKLIDGNKHLILEAAHPSPLSAHRGFMGCGHFGKANEYLALHKGH